MTRREPAHGRSRVERAHEIFITQSEDVVCDGGDDQFPSLPHHWYSLCVFFFHLSVYFSLSGDVRVSVCFSPVVTVRVCADGC